MIAVFMFIAGAVYALLNWVVPQSGLLSTLWELTLGGVAGLAFWFVVQIAMMLIFALFAVGGTLFAHLLSKIK